MSYLEEFVNSVNYLPGEVCRSLELIRLLDDKAKSCTDEFTTLSSEYFSSLKKEQGIFTENTDLLLIIKSKQQKALNLSEEKIAVSKQLLDMIDFHISKLKQDLESYNREISAVNDNPEEKGTKKPKIEKTCPIDDGMGIYIDNMDMQENFEMQGDENRAYCYCGKGSYGEMIECEGAKVKDMQCKREWFHMECVGLTTLPGGSWFCDDCLEEKKKAGSKS